MLVRLVACKTHASAHGVYHAGQTYQVSEEKGKALLDMATDGGDQVFVEVNDEQEAAPEKDVPEVEVAEPVVDADPQTDKKVFKVGGKRGKNESAPAADSGEDTVTI